MDRTEVSASEGAFCFDVERGWLANEVGDGKRDQDHEHAENPQRAAPAERLRQRVSEQGHNRAANADAKIGDTHRLAARTIEPTREQDLIG